MNTRYQNSMENTHAPALDSGFEPNVSTQKVFVKRFDSVSMAQWQEMVEWCYKNLYHGGHYEPNWGCQYPSFYFRDEKEYTLFLLKWS